MRQQKKGLKTEILVIGAGASGLTAAIHAAKMGCTVHVLEAEERPGKKLLATGNGKCNYTNREMTPEKYRGSSLGEISSVLRRYSWQDAVAWLKEIGIWPSERDGYFYPASGQASSVLECLLLEAKRLSVEIHTSEAVNKLEKKKYFRVETASGAVYEADGVILSAGTFAGLRTKNYPDGIALAKKLDLKLQTPVPALTALRADRTFQKEGYGRQWNGVRVNACIRLFAEGRLQGEDTGEVQLTEYGISGIPVFQVSRYASYALLQKKSVCAELDLMPSLSMEQLKNELIRRSAMKQRNAGQQLSGLWNAKLAAVLLKSMHLSAEKTLLPSHCERLAALAKQFSIGIEATNPLEQSQVCAGGVLLSQIDMETMESRSIKGLFLTGELLDADGICGGYNLHWAWATGTIAGTALAKKIKGNKV